MKYNISGKYPTMANWLAFRRVGSDKVLVYNGLTQEECILDEVTYRFLRMLDGDTDPYVLGQRLNVTVDDALFSLECEGLLRTEGRWLVKQGGVFLRTLFVPKKRKRTSCIPCILNLLLMVSWLPILLLGVYHMLYVPFELKGNYMTLGYILSLVIGLIFHEVGHACSCLAYGGRFYEAGVMWSYVFPGAYVLIDKSRVSKLQSVQIDAAGCEMNLLLAGVLLVCMTRFELLSGFFLCSAINNAFLAFVNLSFVSGFDGCSIVGSLLGVKGDIDEIKMFLRRTMHNRVSMGDGPNQGAVIIACTILVVYQILLPVIVLGNILSVFGGLL